MNCLKSHVSLHIMPPHSRGHPNSAGKNNKQTYAKQAVWQPKTNFNVARHICCSTQTLKRVKRGGPELGQGNMTNYRHTRLPYWLWLLLRQQTQPHISLPSSALVASGEARVGGCGTRDEAGTTRSHVLTNCEVIILA